MSLHLFQRNHYLPKKSRCFARKLAYKEAVAASSIANVMIAAILNGDLPLAGKMMEQDKWHETYRRSLVPHLKEIRRLTQQKVLMALS